MNEVHALAWRAMAPSLLLVLAAFLPIAALAQSPRPSPDWPEYEARALERLRDFLRINTSNPPGNEQRAADFFCDLFSKEGIECQVFSVAPGRANAYARLRGDGSRRPIILLNHTDVVTADAKQWSVSPFSAETRDGAIYGRGAQDMKAEGMLHAMAMVALKSEGVPLARDVVFLAVADEEVSSTGSAWMVAQKPELLAGAEYLISEGGENIIENGAVPLWGVDVAEKVPL